MHLSLIAFGSFKRNLFSSLSYGLPCICVIYTVAQNFANQNISVITSESKELGAPNLVLQKIDCVFAKFREIPFHGSKNMSIKHGL